jgi:hypothetical protein
MYNIKMDGKDLGWKLVDSIHGVQDMNQWWAVVNTVMNTRVLCKVEDFFGYWATARLSSRVLGIAGFLTLSIARYSRN